MARCIMTFVAAILLATGVQAQTRQSEQMAYRVKDQAFNHSQVEGISHFITDRLGPRLAASKQKMRAEQLVTDTLKGFDSIMSTPSLPLNLQKAVGTTKKIMWQ